MRDSCSAERENTGLSAGADDALAAQNTTRTARTRRAEAAESAGSLIQENIGISVGRADRERRDLDRGVDRAVLLLDLVLGLHNRIRRRIIPFRDRLQQR
jgi:hypothetical protein